MPYLLYVYRYPNSFFHTKALFSFLTSILIVPHSATFPSRSLWSANAFSLLSPLTTYFSAFILRPTSHFFLLSHAQGLSFALRLNILYLNRLQHSLFLSFVNRPSHQLAFSLPSLFFYLRLPLSFTLPHTCIRTLPCLSFQHTHCICTLSHTRTLQFSLYSLTPKHFRTLSVSLWHTHALVNNLSLKLPSNSFVLFHFHHHQGFAKKVAFRAKMLRLFFLPQSFFFFNLSGICFFNWPVKRRKKKKKKKEKERKKKMLKKKEKKVEEKNQEAQLFFLHGHGDAKKTPKNEPDSFLMPRIISQWNQNLD